MTAASAAPTLYRRLAADYSLAMEMGTLKAGERMSSVRELMRRHEVSLSTALQTLRHLEDLGQLEARPRVGYFVRDARPAGLAPASEPDLSQPVQPLPQQHFAGINEHISLMLERGRQADVQVDLGGATPPPELFDRGYLNQAAARLLREQPDLLVLGRSMMGSHPDFQRAMARRALAAGIHVAPADVLATTGNSEAVSLALAAVASPGDVVAVESPTYYGLLQVVESLQMQALEIPCSPRTGLSIEALELALQTQPRLKAVVVVPELQMPLGTRIPDEHKARLVELCAAHGVALIEDDSYGLFVESSQPVRPIKAWDRLPGHVIYCEAFNKSMAPGLDERRPMAWPCADAQVRAQPGTQTLAQLLAAACVGSPAHLRNLQRLKQQLRRQREGMAQLVARFFPLGTRLSLPPGGLSLWLELPAGVSTSALFTQALARGIRTAPGSMFSNSGRYEHCMRLGCTLPVDGVVEQACRDLGAMACAQLGQPARHG
ncbi:PLP-dependent aminotransferase family protein [Delftia lacustris]|uniref:aminotransferase-like domain-containing protein n=1 Tax=Delftia lacustris TaxID=558537 RepID=UPI001EF04FD1|nr:PLP-dependent aminotransferase family protein [Delftia lacustris]